MDGSSMTLIGSTHRITFPFAPLQASFAGNMWRLVPVGLLLLWQQGLPVRLHCSPQSLWSRWVILPAVSLASVDVLATARLMSVLSTRSACNSVSAVLAVFNT